MFVLCALAGPMAILGMSWALYLPHLRQLGYRVAKFGTISATFFCMASELLHIVLADGTERSAFSMLVTASAGFTFGIIAMCIWKKASQVFAAVRANST